jgi:magnesium transporter
MADWIDLLDPTEEELRTRLPQLDQPTREQLLAAPDPEGRTRPTLRGQGDHVFGVLLSPVLDPDRDRLYYQEIDLVVTRSDVVTVRKTPRGGEPFDLSEVKGAVAAREDLHPGMIVYQLVDEIAERFLDLFDGIDEEIDELEQNVDVWDSQRVRQRITELRQGLLHSRRTLAPTRDAVRAVVDGRVDADSSLLRREVFPEEVERAFQRVLDKLLRASESIEFSRDLLNAVRDYQATQIAYEQSETIRRLTAVASIVLLPTFIVGVYGQNFEHMPELKWRLGYAFSWAVIMLVTIAQLVFFRRRRWI